MSLTFIGQRAYAKYGCVKYGGTVAITTTTATIDRLGFNSAILLVSITPTDVTSGTLTSVLYEGATSSPATAVTLSTTMVVTWASVTTNTIGAFFIDLTGINRYFKVITTAAFSTSSATSTISCSWLLCDPETNPSGYEGATGAVQVMYLKS